VAHLGMDSMAGCPSSLNPLLIFAMIRAEPCIRSATMWTFPTLPPAETAGQTKSTPMEGAHRIAVRPFLMGYVSSVPRFLTE
jgi:hypothetical protein